MAKAKKPTHPLDIPTILIAKGRSPRDEAEVKRICARAAAMQQPLDIEDHDPRILDMIRRGVVSRSILNNPSSIAIALGTLPRDRQEPGSLEEAVSRPPGRGERVARPVDHISAGDIAQELEIDAKLVRQALRALKVEKPCGGWHFPKDEADAITKRIKAWLKVQAK